MHFRTRLWPLPALLLATAGCSRTLFPQNGMKQMGLAANIYHRDVRPRATTTGFVTVFDDLGRIVELAHPARRVVCIGPGATETVFALGQGNLLVGRDQFSNYPAEAKKVEVVGDYRGPFIESTLAVRPDLIIVQGETFDRTRAGAWSQKCRVSVAVLSATSIDGVEQDIRKIAALLGATDLAPALTPWLPSFPNPTKSAFFEVDRPLWTAGGDTLVGDVMRRAGLRNIAGTMHSYKQWSLESLVAADPDYYIVGGEPAERAAIMCRLQNTVGLKDLSCVRKGHVVIVDADLLMRPGPRLWHGIRALRAATESD